MPLRHTPFVLIIRDGWGENPNRDQDAFNAVRLARTPVADRLLRECPHTLIRTSGEDVGLPEGTMGNSEVGHQNIGAGRIVDQESVRITKAVREGTIYGNEALTGAVRGAVRRGGAVHIMGIASDAGVHGLLTHLYGCVELCKREGATKVWLHLFTDGRDTGPYTGMGYVREIEERVRAIGVGRVASVMGRYYAMDRDNRWERVARAYACMTGHRAGELGVGIAGSAQEAVQRYYDNPATASQGGDEFVAPTMIGGNAEEVSASRIRDGDAAIFYNYRGDRPREILRAFVYPEFEGRVKASPDTGAKGFDRGKKIDVEFVTMCAYAEDLNPLVRVAYPKPPKMANIAGAWIASKGLRQFRCAETEKFPHVTFFFNDYRDEPFEGETREIVQSPKVATYDLMPQMSAEGVRDAVLARLRDANGEPFIVVNFANPDMVGHTGKLDAAITACETVDGCVGAILEVVEARGGCAIVTADHGNAEQMWDLETNAPHTAHTTYDVPLIVVGEAFRGRRLREGGRLADIAPTAFEMIGLEAPPEMTGKSLLV